MANLRVIFWTDLRSTTGGKKNENCKFGISAVFFPHISSGETSTIGLAG